MKLLVTGANGFMGKNLMLRLREQGAHETLAYDIDTDEALLDKYCAECDFVFHLAGVNRPKDASEFMRGNRDLTERLISALEAAGNNCPVMLSSSIQAALANPYGESKSAGEALVRAHGERTGARTLIYRFPNVFGKWCRPNYNSAVATFCHNIARDMPITVNDANTSVNLVYIDDIVDELMLALAGGEHRGGDGLCFVPQTYTVTLGELVSLLRAFRAGRTDLMTPGCLEGSFEKKLCSTYLSYLPEDGFAYPLKMNQNERGSFTELMKSPERGQISVNVIKPGIEKGNHYHHTKLEKFIVVGGEGLIRFRRVDGEEVFSYRVSGERIEAVDIPPGYTHSITNVGEGELITLMWSSELYDPERPDTYQLKVTE